MRATAARARWAGRRAPAPSLPPGRGPRRRRRATPPAGRPTEARRHHRTALLAHLSRHQPEERLAAGADQHRPAGGDQRPQPSQQGQVVDGRLPEPEAGVDPHLVDAGVPGPRRTIDQKGTHLGHHVAVLRRLLHRPGLTPHVHRHPAHARLGRHPFQRRRHVVDQGRPRRHRLLGHSRPPGVDGDPHVWRQGRDHGQHPADLLVLRHRFRPRTGALTTHVDHIRPLGHHRQAVGHGRVGIEPPAAVGERVGSHVEDSHHQPAHERRAYWRRISVNRG